MIRQWLKFNTSFVEILKNSSSCPPKHVDQRWVDRKPLVESSHNLADTSGNESGSFKPVASASTSSLFRPIRFLTTLSDPKNRGDGQYSELSDEEDTESAVAETPAQTELFHVKGPDGSAFLIEVHEEDVDEVREELNRLKGDLFSFDKSIIERFTIKCILTAESSWKTDQVRLARIHSISSGAEEFYRLDNSGQFLFINPVDRTMRAKRILEQLGYTVSGILYRFQPSQKIDLEDHLLQVCNRSAHPSRQGRGVKEAIRAFQSSAIDVRVLGVIRRGSAKAFAPLSHSGHGVSFLPDIQTGPDEAGVLGGASARDQTIGECTSRAHLHSLKKVKLLMRYSALPEQIRNYEKSPSEIIQIRGPGNSAFLIEMVPSKDVYEVRFLLKNFILSRHRCRYEQPGISQFERHGYVLTKPLQDYLPMARRASVITKEIGAEDVLELKKTKQLKFLCSPSRIFVTAVKLSESGYEIESSGVHFFPKYMVGLKKKDRITCEKFLKVMNELPNVICIYDNIQRHLI